MLGWGVTLNEERGMSPCGSDAGREGRAGFRVKEGPEMGQNHQ